MTKYAHRLLLLLILLTIFRILILAKPTSELSSDRDRDIEREYVPRISPVYDVGWFWWRLGLPWLKKEYTGRTTTQDITNK